MKLTQLGINGAWLVEADAHVDNRGTFREWFKLDEIRDVTGIEFIVKQANLSVSHRGVIRGIHYSVAINGQAKLVTCASGHVIDVIADIRPNSATFKKVIQMNLRGGDPQAILIGADLGHGFLALEDNSIVTYLLSSPYSPNNEREINPLDSELSIDWHLNMVRDTGHIISTKDAQAPSLAERLAGRQLPQ